MKLSFVQKKITAKSSYLPTLCRGNNTKISRAFLLAPTGVVMDLVDGSYV
jgi:hypothetical protein